MTIEELIEIYKDREVDISLYEYHTADFSDKDYIFTNQYFVNCEMIFAYTYKVASTGKTINIKSIYSNDYKLNDILLSLTYRTDKIISNFSKIFKIKDEKLIRERFDEFEVVKDYKFDEINYDRLVEFYKL